MGHYSVAIYFLIVIITSGILIALYFRYHNAVDDLESKVTGIWSNESNTIRILIYSIESSFQAEVVWTKNIDASILGVGIIRDMNLKYFSWGEGSYIDPFTKQQSRFRLRLKQSGLLQFELLEKSENSVPVVQEWRQVA